MYFLRLLCGFSLLLSFSASGMPLKQQSLFDAGFAPNNDVIHLEDSDDEVESLQPIAPRPRGIAPNNDVIHLEDSDDEVESLQPIAPRPRGIAPNNDVIHLEDSDDEVESLQPIAPRPRGVDSNPLVRPVEEGLQEVRNVRPREEDPDPAEWNILQYIGVDSVRDLPGYLLNARANNLIGPMVEGCDAFQQLQRHRFIKEGNIPRNLFSPDGWLPHLGSGKVLAVLNFISDTRSNPRAVTGNSDGTFVEPCLETIIRVFAAIFVIFGVEISVARIIARCIIVFANRMPFDGRYDWHSRARRSFMEVAGVTDPLQRAVIQHVLRKCINITYPQLPPNTMALGAYMTANGYHVSLDRDLYDVLVQYGNGEERSSEGNAASLRSAQAAAEHDTLGLFGEYACKTCRVVRPIRLGGYCGMTQNGKKCGGHCFLVKNVNGEWIQALDYGLNTGGTNNVCVHNHIGLIGQACVCNCSGTRQSAGCFLEGFDRLDYPLQDAPSTILSYQTRTSDHGIVFSFDGAKALALHLHPILVQMIESTSAVEVKQSYPWAFGSRGALFGVGTGNGNFVKVLTREMIENPNRPIIVGESAYKMRPWDLTR